MKNHKHLRFHITFDVSLDSVNMDEALEKLRETGSAEVTDVEIVEYDKEKSQSDSGCFCS